MKSTPRLGPELLIACALFAAPSYAEQARPRLAVEQAARAIDPIVTTTWLDANRGAGDLVIVDVRPVDAYVAAHLPGSISAPFAPDSAWSRTNNGLTVELPPDVDLFASIGGMGIRPTSRVVIVTQPAAYGLANATRVATTLIYAGVKHTAILDGGFPKWSREGLPTTTEVPAVTPVQYTAETNPNLFVSRSYVERKLGRVVLLDNREPDVYFGVILQPFADKPGHISTASSLPAPWIWRVESTALDSATYLDQETLGKFAAGVIRRSRDREIILYCGVGGYASAWWFVLTQVLGYSNVKLYDGSAQEWVKYHDLIPYRWD